MAVRFTIGSFPGSKELRDATGLPWGCTVQPFAQEEEGAAATLSPEALTKAEEVARCEECYAYISAFCNLDRFSWRCTLCDALNTFTDAQVRRYGNRAKLAECAELAGSMVELDMTTEGDDGVHAAGGAKADLDLFNRPVYVACVDLAASEEFLELVKSALMAALEALSPGALFGLVSFAHKVGLYDIQGSHPVVKYVAIPAKPQPLPVPLEDVVALESFLAPVDGNKDNIAAALETLRHSSPGENGPSKGGAGEGEESVSAGGRGFGSAMEAVVKYLGGQEGEGSFASARLFAFLSGPPDLGQGKVEAQGEREQQDAETTQQAEFYKDVAAAAVQVGVCVDLFVVSQRYCELASLKYLSVESGGGLFLYESTEEATLPQDIYRMLSRPKAQGGVLRLRCSSEFQVVRAYGHFFPDAQYDNLYHIISCDAFDAYTFDFDFTGHSGFGRNPDQAPYLQMVFQYTVIIPLPDYVETPGSETYAEPVNSSSAAPSSNGKVNGVAEPARYVIRRRLRIRTIRIEVARSAREVYESADNEAILASLTHKIIVASLEEGVREGRLLLTDWLVILTALYNDYYKLAQFEQPTTIPQLDVAFVRCPQLQPMPRLVFSLLRSPLLRLEEGPGGDGPDLKVYLQALYGSLDPSYLLRAVYPVLSSYASPDKLAFPRHSLSRAALVTSGSPIFFLDAFTTLIVYYAPTAPPELPFPPPHGSMLRNTINRVKQDRNITPRLIMIRGGVDNTEPFERFLIEEQDVDAPPGSTGIGFVAFLEDIANEVRRYMKVE